MQTTNEKKSTQNMLEEQVIKQQTTIERQSESLQFLMSYLQVELSQKKFKRIINLLGIQVDVATPE